MLITILCNGKNCIINDIIYKDRFLYLQSWAGCFQAIFTYGFDLTLQRNETLQELSSAFGINGMRGFILMLIIIKNKSNFHLRAKKPKTEATSSTNQKNAKVNIIVNQWELKVKTNNLFKARENLSDQVGIGFSFTFNCLRR